MTAFVSLAHHRPRFRYIELNASPVSSAWVPRAKQGRVVSRGVAAEVTASSVQDQRGGAVGRYLASTPQLCVPTLQLLITLSFI
jgi:hypothetical protein